MVGFQDISNLTDDCSKVFCTAASCTLAEAAGSGERISRMNWRQLLQTQPPLKAVPRQDLPQIEQWSYISNHLLVRKIAADVVIRM